MEPKKTGLKDLKVTKATGAKVKGGLRVPKAKDVKPLRRLGITIDE
jgi:hypothetical protein